MAFVYILHSDSLNRFYIGVTETSPQLRLEKHLSNHRGFTSKAKDWKIVFSQQFDSMAKALECEKQIKNWKSARLIRNLIDSHPYK